MVDITELDKVLVMKRYPLEVVKKAYIEMKRQNSLRHLTFLLERGVDKSLVWVNTSQGSSYWNSMYEEYES